MRFPLKNTKLKIFSFSRSPKTMSSATPQIMIMIIQILVYFFSVNLVITIFFIAKNGVLSVKVFLSRLRFFTIIMLFTMTKIF